MEKRGVATVTLVTEWFRSLAEASSKARGMPDLPLVAVPHPFDTIPEAEVIGAADRLFDQAISAIAAGVRVRQSASEEG